MDDEDEYEDEEEHLNKDPEEDTYKFLKLLIQSLQQLGRLDETIEVGLMLVSIFCFNLLLRASRQLLNSKTIKP